MANLTLHLKGPSESIHPPPLTLIIKILREGFACYWINVGWVSKACGEWVNGGLSQEKATRGKYSVNLIHQLYEGIANLRQIHNSGDMLYKIKCGDVVH